MRAHRDSSNRLSITLSQSDSWFIFHKYEKQIKKKFNGKIIEKLRDVDQRGWNFKIQDKILVLQSESVAGISMHIEDGSDDELLRNVAEALLKNKN